MTCDRVARGAALAFLSAGVLLLQGCGDSRAEPGGGPPGAGRGGPPGGADAGRSVPVAVRVAQPSELSVMLRATANLQARDQVEILPKQGGVLARLLVEEGARVAAGQALATLDDEEWRLQAQQAEARARASRDAADRAGALLQQGLLAEQEVVRLRSEADVAAADRDLARLRVANAVIRSPIAGTVTHRFVERGQLVNTSTRAFAVADVTRLEARLGVPERDAQRIRAGQAALIRVEGAGSAVRGRVARVRPVVDPGSGTVQVTVEVDPAADASLRAGQFVNVEIVTETLAERITLPRTAVLVDAARPRVYVVQEGRAVEREVVLGVSEGNQVEIREGVQPGDSIVVVGQDALRPGNPVRLVEVDGQRVAEPAADAAQPGARPGGRP
jgi:membrane fusion protein, multidrug efflux system